MSSFVRIAYIGIIAMLMMLPSCTDDIRLQRQSIPAGELATIGFSLDGNIKSRSESDGVHDKAIDHAYLIFFTDEEAESESRFVAYSRAATSDDASMLSFPIPDGMAEGEHYRLLALANADFFTPDGYEDYDGYIRSAVKGNIGGPSMADLREILCLHIDSMHASPEPQFLPLIGETLADTPFSFQLTGEGYQASCAITLSYSVSRIDITNHATSDIKIIGVMPCNCQENCFPFDSGNHEGKCASPDFSSPYFIPFPDSESEQSLAPAFFCFPNTSPTPSQYDDATTAVILSAFYRDPSSLKFDSVPSYYRVNIINIASSQHLAPNYIYRLSISHVNGRGKASPQEAYAAPASPITISSSDPNVSISGDTISIQAFHPEIYNSFISVPLQLSADSKALGLSQAQAANLSFDIASDIQWPLEGLIGTANVQNLPKLYSIYRTNSFRPESVDQNIQHNSPPDNKTTQIPLKTTFFASVGCLAPDDPDITRNLTITTSAGGKSFSAHFVIRIFARPVIIDDVIIQHSDNSWWMICDRNVQITTRKSDLNPGYPQLDPRLHGKWQAYNYGSFSKMKIPSKFIRPSVQASEDELHPYASGYLFPTKPTAADINLIMDEWKSLYRDDDALKSPFYTNDKIQQWTCIKSSEMKENWTKKLACAKCRLFFVSDIQTRDSIPICCYLPYHMSIKGTSTDSSQLPNLHPGDATYLATSYMNLNSFKGSNWGGVYFACMDDFLDAADAVGSHDAVTNGLYMLRLVRPLDMDELNLYKNKYLGYDGSKPKLTPCHKDSYGEWPQWERTP